MAKASVLLSRAMNSGSPVSSEIFMAGASVSRLKFTLISPSVCFCPQAVAMTAAAPAAMAFSKCDFVLMVLEVSVLRCQRYEKIDITKKNSYFQLYFTRILYAFFPVFRYIARVYHRCLIVVHSSRDFAVFAPYRNVFTWRVYYFSEKKVHSPK